MLELYKKFYDHYSVKYGPNTAIFLMVGKFYELYDIIDAKTEQPLTSMRRAVELMNIALKEKPGEGPKGETVLWGGIPEQSVHKFAQVLTRENWTVVLVDQVKEGDAVVERTTSRVLSPGTHIETATQDRLTVAALWLTEASASTSLVDLMTGEVFSFETSVYDDILHMYQVYGVREVVCTMKHPFTLDEASLRSRFGLRCPVYLLPFVKSNFDQSFAREEFLRTLFRVKGMLPVRASLGLLEVSEQQELVLCSLLRFLQDHFPQHTERLSRHEVYTPSKYMRLSNNILEQLNFIPGQNTDQRSILSMVLRTHSAVGRRHLRERLLRPITDASTLCSRWSEVDWATALETPERKTLEQEVKKLYDLPRLHFKYAEGVIDSLSILQLAQTYTSSENLATLLQSSPLTLEPELASTLLAFRREFSATFDENKAARREKKHLVGFLTELAGPQTFHIEQEIQTVLEEWSMKWRCVCKEMGIAPQDNEFHFESNSEGGYFWEGPRSYLKTITARSECVNSVSAFHVESKKAGPIQIHCHEVDLVQRTLDSKLRILEQYLKQESAAACDRLWSRVAPISNQWVSWLGSIDATLTLASVALDFGWVKPQIGDSLHIEGLRHPILESAQTRMAYVKHTVDLGAAEKGWLLYGVNASGKSSLMKAVGIAVILAQAGSFVPAKSMMVRPYDAAFSRIWTHDNVWAGLSSFAVEVGELREILTLATGKSLVLGDEVCSGTESSSATALVASAIEHLEQQGTHFLFATHLHDLTKIPGFLPRPGIAVWHLRVNTLPNGKLVYERTLQPGPGLTTYGLEVAKAMGLPFSVLQRAHAIRRALEGEMTAATAPKSTWNASIQRRICEHCGAATVHTLEVHHLHPRAEGGNNEARNLAVLCASCHDKHHAGQLEITPLQQTSDGLERVPVAVAVKVSMKKQVRTDEETQMIREALWKYRFQPLKRVESALLEEGVKISVLQLKKFTLTAQAQQGQEQEQEQGQGQGPLSSGEA